MANKSFVENKIVNWIKLGFLSNLILRNRNSIFCLILVKGGKMAREWQQKRQREYVMPDEVYYQTLWAVRDLSRMENQILLMEEEGTYDTIENLSLQSRVNSIKQALQEVPDIYREPILRNIKLRYTGSEFPDVMYKIWKQRFLYNVAKNLSIM